MFSGCSRYKWPVVGEGINFSNFNYTYIWYDKEESSYQCCSGIVSYVLEPTPYVILFCNKFPSRLSWRAYTHVIFILPLDLVVGLQKTELCLKSDCIMTVGEKTQDCIMRHTHGTNWAYWFSLVWIVGFRISKINDRQ